MNHLYIQTAFLGDLLLAIPTLKQIRYWSPQSSITLVCRKGLGPLMLSSGVVDEVVEVDKADKKNVVKKLSAEYHTIFCPHQSMTSHKIVSQVKAKEKLGYKKFWNKNYFTKRIERRLDWPEAIRQLQLLSLVSESVEINLEAFGQNSGVVPQWADMTLSQLSWSEEEINQVAIQKSRGFDPKRPYVCIAPGSVWPTKRWGAHSFIKAATLIARENYQIVILGAPEERELCQNAQKQIPNSYSFAGHLSVLESMMILSKAKGLICNDSGAMHMASVLDCPTLAIFGPTVQELGYKPWNARATVMEDESLLCRPCGQHGSHSCPIVTHQCMANVSPIEVSNKALSIFR